MVTAVGERIDAPADTLQVTTGLFSVTVIDVPFADVVRVDRRRRRVHINAHSAPARVGPKELPAASRAFSTLGAGDAKASVTPAGGLTACASMSKRGIRERSDG